MVLWAEDRVISDNAIILRIWGVVAMFDLIFLNNLFTKMESFVLIGKEKT